MKARFTNQSFLDIPFKIVLQKGFLTCTLYMSIIGPGHAKMCFMPYAKNKGADQPAHPHSLISTFVIRCLDSMIYILAVSKVSRF